METRVLNDKEETGKINCEFYKKKDNLFIVISDDGAGIDIDVIGKVAVDKNIITQKELNNMSDDKKIQIIFLDKFSTSEKLTITSGRGVGMSSVKYELTKLNGKLNITNKIRDGVKFEFIIPLNKIRSDKC
jgi:two-component system chemotaxis sensor kinase CheA